MTPKAQKLLKLNLVLFLIAACVGIYMVHHHYVLMNGESFGSFCSVSESIDCDAVNSSRFSEVLGIPLATLGLTYYLLAAALCLIGIKSAYSRRESILVLSGLSAGSMLATAGTIFLMAAVLKKWCLMCLTMSAFDIATFVVAMLTLRELLGDSSLSKELALASRKKALTYLASGLALLVVVHGASAQLREQRPFDKEDFLAKFRAEPVKTIEVGDSPREGFKGDNPPIQLIEFADFQCPGCAIAARQMHRLVRVYDDKIQLVFKHYPFDPTCNPSVQRSMHEHACLAAKAAVCAHKNGKFTDMYEMMFSRQYLISRDNIMAWAGHFGMNKDEFEKCLTSDEALARVRQDIEAADKAGLDSTPTFYVNGKRVRGAIDEARLKALISELGK